MSFASSLRLPFLNHDVMTYIFKLNTQRPSNDMDFPALHTTRLTSQVCRSWRKLVLQSPVIWGNIIDLDTLSEQWFEEVMKRTGKASLSIYGLRPVRGSSTVKRLISLLEENWDRVRCIDVNVDEDDEDDPKIDLNCFYDIFWKRRAPILEEFRVRISSYWRRSRNKRKSEDLQLFSGSAPLLRCMHSPDFYFDQHAPWISQLVGMILSDPLKICDALAVLAKTPLLETLVIGSEVHYDDSERSLNQNICLPNLHRIEITSNIAGSLIYLSHITPSSDCALKLEIHDDSIDIQSSKNDELQRLSKIISAYVDGYSSVHCPQKLYIYIGDHDIRFDIYEKWDEANDLGYRNPSFKVSISPCFNPEVVNILSTLVPTTLNNVHTFEFRVFRRSWLPTTDALIHIIRSLTAVKKMKLTPSAMHGLNNFSDSATPFPDLAEVRIEYQEKVNNLDDILRLFLTRRRQAGKPLQTLYKWDKSRPRGAKHWVFLNQFEGLRVISTGHGADYSDSSGSDDSEVDDSDGDDSEDDDDKEDYEEEYE